MNAVRRWRFSARRFFQRKVMWQSVEQDHLHTIDEQRFPAQPHSLPLPNEVLREASSIGDLASFYAIGEAWSQLVTNYLPPDPYVLDIGCGCGKLARFLYLNPRLRYLGIDVYAPSIRWCQRAFAGASDRFQFVHFDGRSEIYNPSGKTRPEEYRLPVADGEVDMTVCASLFTHLYETDAKHYLSEIRRVTRPGGRALASVHVEPAIGRRYSGDESRIDVDPEHFIGLCRDAGLPVSERLGAVYGQTVFLLEKV